MTKQWKAGHEPIEWAIFDEDNQAIARCFETDTAEQIVREHNAHAALVEALESALWIANWNDRVPLTVV